MSSTPSLASSSSSFIRPPSSRSITTSVYTTQFDEDEDPWGNFPSTDKATTSQPSTLNDLYGGKKEGVVSDVAFGKLNLCLTLTIKSLYAFVSEPIAYSIISHRLDLVTIPPFYQRLYKSLYNVNGVELSSLQRVIFASGISNTQGQQVKNNWSLRMKSLAVHGPLDLTSDLDFTPDWQGSTTV